MKLRNLLLGLMPFLTMAAICDCRYLKKEPTQNIDSIKIYSVPELMMFQLFAAIPPHEFVELVKNRTPLTLYNSDTINQIKNLIQDLNEYNTYDRTTYPDTRIIVEIYSCNNIDTLFLGCSHIDWIQLNNSIKTPDSLLWNKVVNIISERDTTFRELFINHKIL